MTPIDTNTIAGFTPAEPANMKEKLSSAPNRAATPVKAPEREDFL